MIRYGTEVTLRNNQIYTAVIRVKGEEHSLSFTSRYTPLYSTVRVIRGDFKQLFSSYTDDEILRLIHDNSKLAIETANPAIDESDIPYYVRQYVRYKTELDLVTDLTISASIDIGVQEKLLGEMKITREKQSPYLKDVLSIVQLRLAPWESQLVGMKAAPTGAVRAGATATYPLNARTF